MAITTNDASRKQSDLPELLVPVTQGEKINLPAPKSGERKKEKEGEQGDRGDNKGKKEEAAVVQYTLYRGTVQSPRGLTEVHIKEFHDTPAGSKAYLEACKVIGQKMRNLYAGNFEHFTPAYGVITSKQWIITEPDTPLPEIDLSIIDNPSHFVKGGRLAIKDSIGDSQYFKGTLNGENVLIQEYFLAAKSEFEKSCEGLQLIWAHSEARNHFAPIIGIVPSKRWIVTKLHDASLDQCFQDERNSRGLFKLEAVFNALMLYSLAKGVYSLHRDGLMQSTLLHRDLHADNILLYPKFEEFKKEAVDLEKSVRPIAEAIEKEMKPLREALAQEKEPLKKIYENEKYALESTIKNADYAIAAALKKFDQKGADEAGKNSKEASEKLQVLTAQYEKSVALILQQEQEVKSRHLQALNTQCKAHLEKLNNLINRMDEFVRIGYRAHNVSTVSRSASQEKRPTDPPYWKAKQPTYFSEQTDSWMFGILAYEVWCKVLFSDATLKDWERIIVKRLKPESRDSFADAYTKIWMSCNSKIGAPQRLYELIQIFAWQRPDWRLYHWQDPERLIPFRIVVEQMKLMVYEQFGLSPEVYNEPVEDTIEATLTRERDLDFEMAIKVGNLAALKELAPQSSKIKNPVKLLMNAMINKRPDMALVLLKQKGFLETYEAKDIIRIKKILSRLLNTLGSDPKLNDCLDMLLSKGAPIDAVDNEGTTVLDRAINSNNTDLIKRILNHKDGAALFGRDLGSLMQKLLKAGQAEILKDFVAQAKSSINHQDSQGRTLLTNLLLSIHQLLPETFLKHEREFVELFNKLIAMEASIEVTDREGLNPFLLAIATGKSSFINPIMEKFRVLKKETAEKLINQMARLNGELVNPLLFAVDNKNIVLVNTLIKAGANVNLTYSHGNNLLLACANRKAGFEFCFNELFAQLSETNFEFSTPNINGQTCLHLLPYIQSQAAYFSALERILCRYNKEEILELLSIKDSTRQRTVLDAIILNSNDPANIQLAIDLFAKFGIMGAEILGLLSMPRQSLPTLLELVIDKGYDFSALGLEHMDQKARLKLITAKISSYESLLTMLSQKKKFIVLSQLLGGMSMAQKKELLITPILSAIRSNNTIVAEGLLSVLNIRYAFSADLSPEENLKFLAQDFPEISIVPSALEIVETLHQANEYERAERRKLTGSETAMDPEETRGANQHFEEAILNRKIWQFAGKSYLTEEEAKTALEKIKRDNKPEHRKEIADKNLNAFVVRKYKDMFDRQGKTDDERLRNIEASIRTSIMAEIQKNTRMEIQRAQNDLKKAEEAANKVAAAKAHAEIRTLSDKLAFVASKSNIDVLSQGEAKITKEIEQKLKSLAGKIDQLRRADTIEADIALDECLKEKKELESSLQSCTKLYADARAYFSSNMDTAEQAYRCYDPLAAYVSWANLFVPSDSQSEVFSIAAASGALNQKEASNFIRTRAAYYYLVAMDVPKGLDSNLSQFIFSLAEIRRAHNEGSNTGADNPSCFPGHITRLAKSTLGHPDPLVQIPLYTTVRNRVQERLNTIVADKFRAAILSMMEADLNARYESRIKILKALTMLNETNAVQFSTKPDLDEFTGFPMELVKIRERFVANLGSYAQVVKQVNEYIHEKLKRNLSEGEQIYVRAALANIGGKRVVRQLSDILENISKAERDKEEAAKEAAKAAENAPAKAAAKASTEQNKASQEQSNVRKETKALADRLASVNGSLASAASDSSETAPAFELPTRLIMPTAPFLKVLRGKIQTVIEKNILFNSLMPFIEKTFDKMEAEAKREFAMGLIEDYVYAANSQSDQSIEKILSSVMLTEDGKHAFAEDRFAGIEKTLYQTSVQNALLQNVCKASLEIETQRKQTSLDRMGMLNVLNPVLESMKLTAEQDSNVPKAQRQKMAEELAASLLEISAYQPLKTFSALVDDSLEKFLFSKEEYPGFYTDASKNAIIAALKSFEEKRVVLQVPADTAAPAVGTLLAAGGVSPAVSQSSLTTVVTPLRNAMSAASATPVVNRDSESGQNSNKGGGKGFRVNFYIQKD